MPIACPAVGIGLCRDRVEPAWVRWFFGSSRPVVFWVVTTGGLLGLHGLRAPLDGYARIEQALGPFALRVYPPTVLYDESSSRISDPKSVDLGHGITGQLVTVVYDKRLLTYNLLTWTWGTRDSAQRVMIAAVDNHEDNVVFPQPGNGLSATLRTMFAVFFRGNQATWDSDPTFKDLDLLTVFSRGLIEAQLRRAESTR